MKLGQSQKILVTGGAGYVGSELVRALVNQGYAPRVLDLYIYGRDCLASIPQGSIEELVGDLRDPVARRKALEQVDTVIHLACISNDPSYDLDPELGRSINYDCFRPLLQDAKRAGVSRFIYASSSSVYGVKQEPNVVETLSLEPLTSYSKFKALCESILLEESNDDFCTTIVRPSTVCGWSHRLRLDLVVNILSSHAYYNHKIRVFGGGQLRPNLHIKDMVRFYTELVKAPREKIDKECFNVGHKNHSVLELGQLVQARVQEHLQRDIPIEMVPTDDLRSYHVSSLKAKERLGFEPYFGVDDAISDLLAAFQEDRVPDAMNDDRYYNIKRMQALKLS